VSLALEPGIPGATIKKVLERGLLMPQALLQRHRTNLVQKNQFRVFLQGSQSGIGAHIPDFLLAFIEGIGAVPKHRVIDKTHTPERPGEQDFLLGRGVKPVFVGTFSHVSQNVEHNVR
jgi:hypothetical protein